MVMRCLRKVRGLQDPEDSQEEIDDIHVKSRRAVDRVIHRLRDAVGPTPVITDIAAENDGDDPVQNVVVNAENIDLNHFDDNDDQQGYRQGTCDSLEEPGKHGSQDHHHEGHETRDPNRVEHYGGVILMDN
jgi:hypothetical protein